MKKTLLATMMTFLISGVSYAKDHLKEGGYKFNGLPVPQRKFITADYG